MQHLSYYHTPRAENPCAFEVAPAIYPAPPHDSVGALLVNRAAARFILRTGSAASKGLSAAGRLRPSLPRRQPTHDSTAVNVWNPRSAIKVVR